jgi:signal transduction histidine kinase
MAEGVQHDALEAVESMADVVWALKGDHDSTADLGRRIRYFATNAAPEGWDLDVRIGELHGRGLGPEVRRNVYLVAKEAVHNAVKHSGATSLTVALTETKGWLQLAVTDDGRGIADTGASPLGGNGLRSMRTRAEAVGGSLEVATGSRGTSVTMRVPTAGARRRWSWLGFGSRGR